MSIPVETLEADILRLPAADRARLLDRVVARLDVDHARDAAWENLAAQREASLAANAAEEVSLDEALARLRAERS